MDKELIKQLDGIFRPKSIAVIGASRRKGSFGREILRNLIEFGFNGKVFPVNQEAEVVHSMKCYHNILEIPDEIDLAIVCVPRQFAVSAVQDCGRKGVKGLIVITAGFREIGEEGAKLEDELTKVVRKYNMRMVGPNCMGAFNTDPDIVMHATFAPVFPTPGDVAFISQSGGMGVAILTHAAKLDLGFSIFVSVGNKADVSGNDLLEYCGADKNTNMILMYIESFGNPRKFTRIAREISLHKPIVAVKSGRTTAGALAASSHTGALADVDVAVEALFGQCGIIRVDTMDELFDVASAFSTYRFPKGNKIAIITNGGGPAILATDAAINNGLEMARFEEKTNKALRKALPAEASIANPVDMIGTSKPREYEATLEALIADKNVDGIIALYILPEKSAAMPVDVALAIADVNKRTTKPILSCFVAKEEIIKAMAVAGAESHLPMYTFPEGAVRAMAAMVRYNDWLNKDHGKIRKFKVDTKKVSSIFAKILRKCPEGCYLSQLEVREVLDAYGIPMAGMVVAHKAEDAVKAAKNIGFPVVMKIMSDDIIHKSDIGGVAIDIRSADEVRDKYNEMMKNVKKAYPKAKIEGVLVQEMVSGGKETILGVTMNPAFGPLLMFGLGGIYVEILKDVVFRINPITDKEAEAMVESLRGVKLLKGVRGEKPVSIPAITDALMRLSQLISDFSEIAELDINPFMVFEKKQHCKAVDARIRIKPVEK